MEQLKIDVDTQAGCVVLAVTGDLDLATCGSLRDSFARWRARGLPMIADLTDVAFCGVSGLRTLLLASEQGRAVGVPLRIVPSAAVLYLVDLIEAGSALNMYPDRNHALADAVYEARAEQAATDAHAPTSSCRNPRDHG